MATARTERSQLPGAGATRRRVNVRFRTVREDRCGPGTRRHFAAHLLDAASALESVAGCLLYVVSRDPEDDDAVWVMEVWESVEAPRGSLERDVVQELIARARPVIPKMGERFELMPLGGKGLRASA